MGLDVGFRKTGVTVFKLEPARDVLVYATTVVSSERDCEEDEDVFEKDVVDICNMTRKLTDLFIKWKPKAIFAEMPSGGSKSARATRCMGMITGLVGSLLYTHGIPFEMFRAGEVEKALGIKLKAGKGKGMKASERQKFKKERSKKAAMSEWPLFKDWPSTKALAEDAYDSAATFIAARSLGTLYNGIRLDSFCADMVC
jgi:Holliday junction resolvasome RuvABC endonuclease subunit